MKLKSKIKQFIDKFSINEDLQKEKCKKTFDKIKLFTLTREKLFLGMLLPLIIINILIGVDYNDYYIRAILSFLFLIIIPGLIIMLCFKVRRLDFWEYLVYTIGLSISFIMFAGLIINWTLPALNIIDKPLATFPILICFNIFLIILGIIAWIKNQDLKPLTITAPKLDWTNKIFFTIPLLFPALAILGAFLLNNHGTNILTIIMLSGIAIYTLLLTIFRKHLNENVYPWALYFIGLSLLLSFSLRSWFVLGWDIHQEIQISKIALSNNFWDISLINSAYNACASLTVFIPILFLFTKIQLTNILKFLIQILFAFCPVIIFLFYKKISKNTLVIFLSCFFFISQVFFYKQMPALIRQEIAFLFFALFFLLLFSEKNHSRKSLMLIFGASIIISHYSTSYIFLFSIIFSYILISISQIKFKTKKIFSVASIIVLILLGFFWTTQLTDISGGLVGTIHQTYNKMDEIFNSESRSDIIQDLSSKKINYYQSYTDYSTEMKNQKNTNNYPLNQEDYPKFIYFSINPISNDLVYKIIYYSNKIIASCFKLLIILGVFLSFLFLKIKNKKDYFICSSFFVLILILMVVLPYISFRYNFERLFLQALIIIALPVIYSGIIMLNFIFRNKKYSQIIFTILLIYFFISISFGTFYLFSGGQRPNIILENNGDDFNKFYLFETEKQGLIWIDSLSDQDSNYNLDKYSNLKILSTLPEFDRRITYDIFPTSIKENSYVFSSNINKEGISMVRYNEVPFKMEFPNNFLNKNKNKIYNNGGSEIFR